MLAQNRKRKIAAAPGADSWRTAELQMWPLAFWDTWALFVENVADGGQWPQVIRVAIMALLPKTDSLTPGPLDKRPITLASA